MQKVFAFFVKIYIKILTAVVSIFSKNPVSKTMSLICQAVESKTEYAAFQVKPKDSTDIPVLVGLNRSQSFAIVLQGPICTKDKMTLNTIRFYKKVYPYANIIVSTWSDEPKQVLEKLQKAGAVIVTSEKPKNSGTLNVNLQLVNSLAGVKKAKELGCKFAVKTRTDQRICKPYIFDSMLSAIEHIQHGKYQNGRLITLGITGGGLFLPYFMSDFLYLGYTDDLIRLFSAPLDERTEKNPYQIIYSSTRRQNAEKMLAPEIYIFKHYCKDVLKYPCEDTVEAYWNIIKNNIICFGMKDVDLMWQKYGRLYDLNSNSGAYKGKGDSSERLDTLNYDFFNWLNLYTGSMAYDKKYEKYADMALYQSYGKKVHR